MKVLLLLMFRLSIEHVDSFVTISSKFLRYDVQHEPLSMVTSAPSDILRPKDSLQPFPNSILTTVTTSQPIQLRPIPNLNVPPLNTLPALSLLPTLLPSLLPSSQTILPPTAIILTPSPSTVKKEETWGKLGTLRVEATGYLFLQKEMKIGEHHLINIMAKHPSILYLRVESNLRPTVEGDQITPLPYTLPFSSHTLSTFPTDY